MFIKLPYGKGHKNIEIENTCVNGVMDSKASHYKALLSETQLVQDALNSPIESSLLSELVKNNTNIVIISSDHTRPVPSHITMPILIKTIRDSNPEAEITILIATGAHRATTVAEMKSKYGDEIVDSVNIHIHDSKNDSMVDLGKLPSGGSLMINRVAMEADLLIAEGFIEPHFFAGFSGGRKSILPGVVSYETVLANHCAEFIDSKHARTGILESNPLHIDMIYAAKQAKLAFILNVVIDADKRVIKAFAGDREKAHYAGCEFVKSLAGVDAVKSDIVITTNGGYPLDQNIYQAVKGMTAAEATVTRDGVIIMVSECSDGHGGEAFYNTFRNSESPESVMSEILSKSRSETVPDQWESQVLARILMKHEVIMVTEADSQIVTNMHMHFSQSVDGAISMAKKIIGKEDPSVTIIPDGVSVIVK